MMIDTKVPPTTGAGRQYFLSIGNFALKNSPMYIAITAINITSKVPSFKTGISICPPLKKQGKSL